MKKYATTLALALACAPLLAQDEDLFRRLIVTDGVDIAGEFLIAVVAGVIIAFATQYLLTALSVAIGISAVPNLKKAYAQTKARDTERGRAAADNDWNEYDHEADDTPTGVKISSAAGAWNLVTTAIALFTGAAFGLTLVPTLLLAPQIAITIALVIWGLFFITLFWLESRFASTIVGTLISAATSGLKTAAASVAGVAGGVTGGVANLVTPSPEKRIANVAESTIDELDARFGDRFDTDRIVAAIEDFTEETQTTVRQTADDVAGGIPSYDQLMSDIREIAMDSSREGKPAKSNPAKWTAIQSVIQSAVDAGDDSGSADGKEKSAQLKKLMSELKAEYEETGDIQAATKSVAKEHADDEQVEKVIGKIQDSLTSLGGGGGKNGKPGDDGQSGGGKLDVAAIQRELEGVLGEGGSVDTAKVKARLRDIDREQVVALVAGNTSLSEEQVAQYADQAEQAVKLVGDKLAGDSRGDGSASAPDLDAVTERARAVVARFIRAKDPTGGKVADALAGKEGAPDLGKLRRQLIGALTGSGGGSGSSDTLGTISRKLKSFDRDTVIGLLTDNTSLTRAQLADYGRTLDEAIAEVQGRVDRLGRDSQSALRQAERRAAIEAEHARKTAASAAWWLVLCIVVSGVAAVGGALLGGL